MRILERPSRQDALMHGGIFDAPRCLQNTQHRRSALARDEALPRTPHHRERPIARKRAPASAQAETGVCAQAIFH
ncbi:hypothetical protein XCR_0174 [Xanthomonas campestris pv. raphani 756C]|nr:hypothetical protein XCR_0174 [Xanthomonas campestris pv. raphani 756C]